MDVEELEKEKLWNVLVETVHSIVMYPNHKAYTREVILQEKAEITAQQLSSRLGISFGEALVILYELKQEKKTENPETGS